MIVNFTSGGGGGRVKGGFGQNNDVLTTCNAMTSRFSKQFVDGAAADHLFCEMEAVATTITMSWNQRRG